MSLYLSRQSLQRNCCRLCPLRLKPTTAYITVRSAVSCFCLAVSYGMCSVLPDNQNSLPPACMESAVSQKLAATLSPFVSTGRLRWQSSDCLRQRCQCTDQQYQGQAVHPCDTAVQAGNLMLPTKYCNDCRQEDRARSSAVLCKRPRWHQVG